MQAIDRRIVTITAVAAASIAASGIALYVLLQPPRPGSIATPQGAPASATAPGAPAPPGVRPLDQMAERLAARLAKDGGSAADWALLGRSYREMARWPEAVQAFEKSIALAPGDAQVKADLDAARAELAEAKR
jgi:cytochrome c-type biogenesis protein CcmH